MAHRLDIELTSSRDDGTWTWRAAGARQPKGVLDGSLLYDGASQGDVMKVEAEMHLDGIEILQVFPPKQKKKRGNILEIKQTSWRDDELVTEVRAKRGRGGRDRKGGGRRERGDGRDRKGGGRGEGRGRGGDRPRGGERGRGGDRSRDDTPPKPKRLKPRRNHRNAVMAEVPEEFRPIAEQVSKGGLPAVRTAIEKQNAEAKEAGGPPISSEPILKIAEDLIPKLRAAEWRDRADAAMAGMDDLDLRDLRAVVGASEGAGRDEESQELVTQLRAGLNDRIEKDHKVWVTSLGDAMTQGRTVRALRLSSRPVKPGSPIPSEIAAKLAEDASASLTADTGQDRWATVIDAVAFSPIRSAVAPLSLPAEPSKELLDAVRRVADRVPEIAALFGIDPSETPKRRRPRRGRPNKGGGGKKPQAPKADKAPEVKVEEAPEVKVEEAPEVKVEEAPEVKVEEAPEVKVEEAPEVKVEKAPKADKADKVEEAPEVKVEKAPKADKADKVEEAPEVKVEEAPEAKVEEAPEAELPPRDAGLA